jgi:NAD(P)-dependent dehydrogenase (short-subunit alcohol dehydrogenase family)
MKLQDGKTYNPWAAYGQSKTANNLTALELARRLKLKNVQSYSLHPGGKSQSAPKPKPRRAC